MKNKFMVILSSLGLATILLSHHQARLNRRHLQEQLDVSDTQQQEEFHPSNLITPLPDICSDGFPPLHAMLHDRRPDQKDHYEQTIGKQTTLWNSKGDDTPRIEVRQDVKFAVWKMFKHYHTESSAWNSLDDYVKGPGWRAPIHPNKPVMELEGNWAAFTSWFLDNYGHFIHDHLATIAYLRSVVPASTGFLLVDCPVSRKVIKFIDEEFYNRIKWIGRDELYHIKGTLTVAVPVAIPIAFGCCGGFDPMRQWIAEKHPDRPEKKLIVYYSRGGSTDTTHGRVIHPDLDKQIIEHIKAKMEQYGKKEDFVIFNGQYKGKTMPIEMQYAVFRSASTIIGPHGSGLGGNFVWTNPFARTCEERTQLLEFIPGQESAQVQILYATYFPNIRKWPLDYHSILYQKESTVQTTYINIQDLDDALDYMWGGGKSATS